MLELEDNMLVCSLKDQIEQVFSSASLPELNSHYDVHCNVGRRLAYGSFSDKKASNLNVNDLEKIIRQIFEWKMPDF